VKNGKRPFYNVKDEWGLRLPRFLRFRGFKIGEKIYL